MAAPVPAAPVPAAPAPDDAGRNDGRDDGGPRLYGVVDVLRPERIAGWVIDRRDARAALDVEIRREGRLVATVKATRPRRDLEKAGVGTGRYGFACDLDPPLEPGFEFTVAATARAADGTAEDLRRPARPGADPDRRLLERIFEELRRPQPETPAETLAETPAELRDIAARLELAQARIEARLAALDAPPAPPPATGLRLLVAVALALATASLATGVVSMVFP